MSLRERTVGADGSGPPPAARRPAPPPSPPPPTVLVVDCATGDRLAPALAAAGFRVCLAATAAEGRSRLETEPPDALVLGLTVPDIEVLALCASAKARGGAAPPVLLRTAPGQTALWELGLQLGADDFVGAPADGPEQELAVRVAAALRRAAATPRPPAADDTGNDGQTALGAAPADGRAGLTLAAATQSARLAGAEVRLTPIEFQLLGALAARPGEVVTRAALIRLVWAADDRFVRRALTTHVGRLRAKLAAGAPAAAPAIVAVRAIGYRLLVAPSPAAAARSGAAAAPPAA